MKKMGNTDLINREELFEELNCINLPVGNEIVDKIFNVIENMPSAESGIIRCKDCNYACIDPERESDEIYCSENDFWKDDDFYCGYAERRTDGVDS